MSNNMQDYGEQELMDVAAFWRRLIDELEIKNPDDVMPEMREALADTEACLKKLTASNG